MAKLTRAELGTQKRAYSRETVMDVNAHVDLKNGNSATRIVDNGIDQRTTAPIERATSEFDQSEPTPESATPEPHMHPRRVLTTERPFRRSPAPSPRIVQQRLTSPKTPGVFSGLQNGHSATNTSPTPGSKLARPSAMSPRRSAPATPLVSVLVASHHSPTLEGDSFMMLQPPNRPPSPTPSCIPATQPATQISSESRMIPPTPNSDKENEQPLDYVDCGSELTSLASEGDANEDGGDEQLTARQDKGKGRASDFEANARSTNGTTNWHASQRPPSALNGEQPMEHQNPQAPDVPAGHLPTRGEDGPGRASAPPVIDAHTSNPNTTSQGPLHTNDGHPATQRELRDLTNNLNSLEDVFKNIRATILKCHRRSVDTARKACLVYQSATQEAAILNRFRVDVAYTQKEPPTWSLEDLWSGPVHMARVDGRDKEVSSEDEQFYPPFTRDDLCRVAENNGPRAGQENPTRISSSLRAICGGNEDSPDRRPVELVQAANRCAPPLEPDAMQHSLEVLRRTMQGATTELLFRKNLEGPCFIGLPAVLRHTLETLDTGGTVHTGLIGAISLEAYSASVIAHEDGYLAAPPAAPSLKYSSSNRIREALQSSAQTIYDIKAAIRAQSSTPPSPNLYYLEPVAPLHPEHPPPNNVPHPQSFRRPDSPHPEHPSHPIFTEDALKQSFLDYMHSSPATRDAALWRSGEPYGIPQPSGAVAGPSTVAEPAGGLSTPRARTPLVLPDEADPDERPRSAKRTRDEGEHYREPTGSPSVKRPRVQRLPSASRHHTRRSRAA